MNKKVTIGVSIGLIAFGILALLGSFANFAFGFSLWRFWPLIIIGAGVLLALPPLLKRDKPGLGALFIPAMPVLATGGILLLDSLFYRWSVWALLWPLEVQAVALGFLLAGFFTKSRWLFLPAIVTGLNGLLFQFCTLTGYWDVWSVLWIIEPLSIGLGLLIANSEHHSASVSSLALVMLALAGAGLVASLGLIILSAIFPLWRMWRWLGSATLILAGGVLLLWGILRRSSATDVAISA